MGHLCGVLPEQIHVSLFFEVQDRPEVQLSRTGVGIVHGFLPVALHHGGEFGYIGRKVRHGHRSILDAGHGFPVPDDIAQQSKARRSQGEGLADVIPPELGVGVTHLAVFEVLDQPVCPVFRFLGTVRANLHHEHGPGVTLDKEAVARLFPVVSGAVQDGLVHELAHEEVVLHGRHHGFHALLYAFKMSGHQNFIFRRQIIQLQRYIYCKCKCSFTSTQKL